MEKESESKVIYELSHQSVPTADKDYENDLHTFKLTYIDMRHTYIHSFMIRR